MFCKNLETEHSKQSKIQEQRLRGRINLGMLNSQRKGSRVRRQGVIGDDIGEGVRLHGSIDHCKYKNVISHLHF